MPPPVNKDCLWMVLIQGAEPCSKCGKMPELLVDEALLSKFTAVKFRAWCGTINCNVAIVTSMLPPGFGGFEDIHATMKSLVEVWNAKQTCTLVGGGGQLLTATPEGVEKRVIPARTDASANPND